MLRFSQTIALIKKDNFYKPFPLKNTEIIIENTWPHASMETKCWVEISNLIMTLVILILIGQLTISREYA